MFDAEPEGWESVSLSDCLDDFRNGWTYDTRAESGTLPITRIETISAGEINYDKVGFAVADERIEAFRLRKNDILFSHINSVEHIAKVAIKLDDEVLYHGMNLMRLRPNRRVDPAFLFARLQSRQTREHFRSACKRAVNQASLNKGEIGSYSFLLPPLSEQRRIAEVLRSVDEAITRQRHVERQIGRARAHIARAVLADPESGASTGHSTYRLLDVSRPRQHPIISAKDLKPTGFPVYGANGQIGFYDKITHADPVIAITCRGATCGTVNWVPANSYVTGNAMAIDEVNTRLVDIRFLYHYLTTWGVRRSVSGSAQPQITRQSLSCIDLIVPPMEVQRTHAETLDALEEAEKSEAQALQSLQQTKQQIASDLLSGRVRVPA